MRRNGWIALVGVSLVLFVISAFVVDSSSPGIGGTVADVAFFGWVLTVVAMIALGVRALARRFRPNGT
jgi:ABC-type Co2+ transport system permease subunit